VLASLLLAQRPRAGREGCVKRGAAPLNCASGSPNSADGEAISWRVVIVRPAWSHCAARDHACCVDDGVAWSWAMESPSCKGRPPGSEVVRRDCSWQRVCAAEAAVITYVQPLLVQASAKGPPKSFWRPNLCADRNRFGRQVRSLSFSC
jgi:hypothetical protein